MAHINGNEILFSSEINIQLGKPEQEKTVDITDNGTVEVFPDEGCTLSKVTANVNVPTASGENKLPAFIDGTLTDITAADLEGLTTIGAYAFAYRPINSVELPSTLTTIGEQGFTLIATTFKTLKYQGTTGEWAQMTFNSSNGYPTNGNIITNYYFLNNLGEYYKLEDDLVIEGATKISAFAFYYQKIPRNITIGSSIKEVGSYAFSYCDNCITLTLNEGLETMHPNAFRYLNALQDVVIPNSVKTIGIRALGNSTSLNEVRIGNGITSISGSAFSNCPNLTDIYIDKPEGLIEGSPWGASSATIHWNTPLPTEGE